MSDALILKYVRHPDTGKVDKAFLRALFKTRLVNVMSDASFALLIQDPVVIHWLLAEYSKHTVDLYTLYKSNYRSKLQTFANTPLSAARIDQIDLVVKAFVNNPPIRKTRDLMMELCAHSKNESLAEQIITRKNLTYPAEKLATKPSMGTVNILRNSLKAHSTKTIKPKSEKNFSPKALKKLRLKFAC